jgi:hypothetical protein
MDRPSSEALDLNSDQCPQRYACSQILFHKISVPFVFF